MTYPITIKPTTDGQTPKYTSVHPDGHRAVIDSVTGTVANGETLTINGHFSAKRDGDLFSLIPTSADTGESVFPTYHYTQAESFLGGGASIMRSMHNVVGTGDPRISLGQHDELYVSYLFKMNMFNYGVVNDSPQIKTLRPMVKTGTENAPFNMSIIINGEGLTYAGGPDGGDVRPAITGYGTLDPIASELTREGTDRFLNTWVREWCYLKKESDGLNNGSGFVCFKLENTKECIFNWYTSGKHANDARKTNSEILSPFFTPKYFHVIDPNADLSGTDLMLPFYIRGGLEIDCYIGGVIANDSPEGVWLVDSTDVDASMATGKAVHIPSSARSETQITATCWLGDFTTSDNVYLTTFNQDGKYATPQLIRSAA